jgi:hypothetical protein
LFKSPSQALLAPFVSQTSNRQSDSDSAAARFVSSLSEAHLQSMLSDLLVEKNALAKVFFLRHHVARKFLTLAKLLNDSGRGHLGSGLPSDVRSCHAVILSLKTEVQMLHQGQQQTVASLRAQLKEASGSGARLARAFAVCPL